MRGLIFFKFSLLFCVLVRKQVRGKNNPFHLFSFFSGGRAFFENLIFISSNTFLLLFREDKHVNKYAKTFYRYKSEREILDYKIRLLLILPRQTTGLKILLPSHRLTQWGQSWAILKRVEFPWDWLAVNRLMISRRLRGFEEKYQL